MKHTKIKNILIFHNLKRKDINFILKTITTKIDKSYKIDFNKIIPEPTDEYGYDCIEGWRFDYWGTMQEAFDCHTKITETNLILTFFTLDHAPHLIIEQLTLLGYNFKLEYASEDLGLNCGRIVYNEYGIVHYTKATLPDPRLFAEEVWED